MPRLFSLSLTKWWRGLVLAGGLLAGSAQALAQTPAPGTDYYAALKGKNLGYLWHAGQLAFYGTKGADPFPEPLGFIGTDYQRFYLHYTSVQPVAATPGVYRVAGKTRVKNNVCAFTGTITVLKAVCYTAPNAEYPQFREGELTCRVALDEDRRQPGSTPASAEKFAAMFGPGGPGDYGPLYTRLLAGSGLRDDDVADAFAAYTVLTYQVAHGEAATLPNGPSAAVRTQYAPLAANMLAGQPDSLKAQLGELMKLQAVLVYVGAQQPNPAFRQNVARKFLELYKLDVNALTLTDQGLVGPGGASAVAAPAAPAGTPTPAAARGTGVAAGAQWFFRSRGDAYGGITFEPVALLPNGQYCDVGEEPLESLDLAADQARRSRSWGVWRKNGDTFELGPEGKSISYKVGDGSWFPAYPAGATPLKRTYKNSSGGSVGGTTSLVVSKLHFVDDTHFTEGADGGVVTANAAGGSRRSASGTYQLQGHTLTLTYADGRTVRQSFAIGAAGDPPRPSNSMVFIGGDAYVEED